MPEKEWDKILNIKTTGIREWDGERQYHRYEATPYKDLDTLFNSYKIDSSSKVVDFGVGRGRVAFYINYRFNTPVIGIEANDTTYDEAIKNREIYEFKNPNIKGDIEFKYGLAEKYKINKEENIFYFFNPFSVNIFKKVVKNILKSLKKYNRDIDIILYYPMPKYKKFIEKKTPFKLLNRIKIPGKLDAREEFRIYRYKKE